MSDLYIPKEIGLIASPFGYRLWNSYDDDDSKPAIRYFHEDKVIALTEERDRLKEELERQAGLLEMTSEGWAKQLADVLAERDKAREYGAEARILGTKAEDKRIHEQHRASVAEAERDRLALANAELLAGLDAMADEYLDYVEADMGRELRSRDLPAAWHKARALLDKHKATSTEPEGE